VPLDSKKRRNASRSRPLQNLGFRSPVTSASVLQDSIPLSQTRNPRNEPEQHYGSVSGPASQPHYMQEDGRLWDPHASPITCKNGIGVVIASEFGRGAARRPGIFIRIRRIQEYGNVLPRVRCRTSGCAGSSHQEGVNDMRYLSFARAGRDHRAGKRFTLPCPESR